MLQVFLPLKLLLCNSKNKSTFSHDYQLQVHSFSSQMCVSSQEMTSAVITYCGHFFHGNCLRKWLYVQETCPMCHQKVQQAPAGQKGASGDGPAAPRHQRGARPDLAAQEEEQNPNNSTARDIQSDDVLPDPAEQQESSKCSEDGEHKDVKDLSEPRSECFCSSQDFVESVSSGIPSSSSELLGKTSNMHRQAEVNGTDSPASTPAAVKESTQEDWSNSELSGLQNVSTFHPGCEETPQSSKSGDSLDPTEAHKADTDQEAASCGTSIVDHHTFDKSCNQKSVLLNCTNPPGSGCGNCKHPGLGEAERVPQIPQMSSDATCSCKSTDSSD